MEKTDEQLLVELKAQAYDFIAIAENANKQLAETNQQIQEVFTRIQNKKQEAPEPKKK